MSEVKTSRTLLVSEILRGDPCYEYSNKLGQRFTDKIEVSVELALSQANDWDWYWAASRLLTVAGYQKFAEILDAAEESQTAQLRPYRDMALEGREAARIEYNRVLAIESDKPGNWYSEDAYRAANKAYAEIADVSEQALEGAHKVTRRRVNKIAAEAFASLYIGEEGTEEQTGNDRWYGRDDDYDSYDDYSEDEDY